MTKIKDIDIGDLLEITTQYETYLFFVLEKEYSEREYFAHNKRLIGLSKGQKTSLWFHDEYHDVSFVKLLSKGS